MNIMPAKCKYYEFNDGWDGKEEHREYTCKNPIIKYGSCRFGYDGMAYDEVDCKMLDIPTTEDIGI